MRATATDGEELAAIGEGEAVGVARRVAQGVERQALGGLRSVQGDPHHSLAEHPSFIDVVEGRCESPVVHRGDVSVMTVRTHGDLAEVVRFNRQGPLNGESAEIDRPRPTSPGHSRLPAGSRPA